MWTYNSCKMKQEKEALTHMMQVTETPKKTYRGVGFVAQTLRGMIGAESRYPKLGFEVQQDGRNWSDMEASLKGFTGIFISQWGT
ncbi:hypothetical protein MKX08_000713 [Trichoderma sp. CBMAI-0020]|nr:hypothetical protein MKX08_000713 [Trichoderma sp. CBMAI-0020]